MPQLIDLLDRLPPIPSPLERGAIVEPVAPFLHQGMDSFEAWVMQRNYELGNPPMSLEDYMTLRRRWRR